MADFEWDPVKAEANLRKHGVSFLKAILVFSDSARVELPDTSDDRDEDRWLVIGRVEPYILLVVFTQREERIRLISARKADRNEQQIYWSSHLPS
jgi:uncharacterized DUF497 family protein